MRGWTEGMDACIKWMDGAREGVKGIKKVKNENSARDR